MQFGWFERRSSCLCEIMLFDLLNFHKPFSEDEFKTDLSFWFSYIIYPIKMNLLKKVVTFWYDDSFNLQPFENLTTQDQFWLDKISSLLFIASNSFLVWGAIIFCENNWTQIDSKTSYKYFLWKEIDRSSRTPSLRSYSSLQLLFSQKVIKKILQSPKKGSEI